MITLIYRKPVRVHNENAPIFKKFMCEVDLIRTSNEGSDLMLKLTDIDTNEVIEEVLTVPGLIDNIDKLEEYLLSFTYFEKSL